MLLQFSKLGAADVESHPAPGSYAPPRVRRQNALAGERAEKAGAIARSGCWKLIDPLCVRFSQPRMRPTFSDGRGIDEAVREIEVVKIAEDEEMEYSELLRPPFPAISIISFVPKLRRPDGSVEIGRQGLECVGERAWFTFDNRRLQALQMAAVQAWPARCCVLVWCVEDVPEAGCQVRKFQTTTEGRSIDIGRRNDEKLVRWAWQDAVALVPKQVDAVPIGPTVAAQVAKRTEGVSPEDLYSGDNWSRESRPGRP